MADLFYTGGTTSSLNLDTAATYGTIDTGDLGESIILVTGFQN